MRPNKSARNQRGTAQAFQFDHFWNQDANNTFGATATPLIFSNIRIEGNGSTLQWVGSGNSRLFAVGTGSLVTPTGHLEKGENPRFVGTSLSPEAWPAQALYEEHYCGRGDMENRIKEQLMLFSDRTSTHYLRSNHGAGGYPVPSRCAI